MELVNSKRYLNYAKIFASRLFKMAANQTLCPTLEQRSVITSLLAEKYKTYQIYRIIGDISEEARNNYKLAKHSLDTMSLS